MVERLDELSGSEKRELLERLLKEKAARAALAAAPKQFPQSIGQQGLWFAFRRNPSSTESNVFFPSRFRSKIDLGLLRQSIEAMVNRHDAFRTVFDEDESGLPVQRILEQQIADFRIIETPHAGESELKQLMLGECQSPFDLTTGPLLRIRCYRISDDDVVVLAVTHHIIVDFWSLVVMLSDAASHYSSIARGKTPDLAPVQSNYHEFVRQQSDWMKTSAAQESLAYWESALSESSPLLRLPIDFERPPEASHRAGVVPVKFSKHLTGRVHQLARQFGVTENSIVLSLVQVLVAKFSGQDQFAIGMPFSGRFNRQFESTIGFFVNMLPIPADLGDNPTFESLAKSVGRSLIDALAHERLPFSEIVRHVAKSRDNSHHPLFQVSCTFEKSHVKSEQGRAGFLIGGDARSGMFAGLRQEAFPIDFPTCLYDLEFVFEFDQDHLQGMICYAADLFDPATIASMASTLETLAVELLERPTVAVKGLALGSKHRPTIPCESGSQQTVCELLSESDHPIIDRAKRFGAELVRIGVRPDEVVPVVLPRGEDAWVAIIGLMYSGAVPVPLDDAQPAVQASVLCDDASIRFVIANSESSWADAADLRRIDPTDLGKSAADLEGQFELPEVVPGQAAYVIYTSGSTGKPKGVVVAHSAICNTLRWRQKDVCLQNEDRVLVLLSHQFDAAMGIVLSSIHQGATLEFLPGEGPIDLDRLMDFSIRQQVSVLPAVPSLQAAVADHSRASELVSLRQIWCGGETLTHDVLGKIRRHFAGELWNFYGPTEAAVEATAVSIDRAVDRRRPIPIGRPIDGVGVDIVDEGCAVLPTGAIGQIAISGNGLASGYLNRPSLTEQAFVRLSKINDATGHETRFYLTGDRGRKLPDGSIEFLGRLDNQVKISGYRIEIEEVERFIDALPGVNRSALIVDDNNGRVKKLVAFVELDPSADLQTVKDAVHAGLPAYKRPSAFVQIERLPVGTSGKVLRNQLVYEESDLDDQESTLPETALERFLVEAFCESLPCSTIGLDQNFFESGGASLDAAMLASRLSRDLSINVSSSLLFEQSDVRSIATQLSRLYPDVIRDRFDSHSVEAALRGDSDNASDSLVVPMKSGGSRPPIFMIHPPGGIVLCYRELAKELDSEQPLYAIRSRGLFGEEPLPETIQCLASDYAQEIVHFCGENHVAREGVTVGGWSLGGVMAYEVARQLIADGIRVNQIVLLDSTVPERCDPDGPPAGKEYGLELSLDDLAALAPEEQLPYLYDHAKRLGVLDESEPEAVVQKIIEDLQRLFAHHVQICQQTLLEPVDVPLLLFRPSESPAETDARKDRGWGRWARDVQVETVSGHHHSMVSQPGASEIAKRLTDLKSQSAKPEAG
ncbi:amino acid adenylation domain-containing protein [Stieleria sp. JC731]|uniref:non-ribosomal peptide synthetase n=1 Tax=Pirellulaceae TaxID=2691357 RepID=UPI001E4F36B9|nr:non-ribosomal peptide synthetase [Stieleria sp. JC731]MCC9602831.1 amino acid adenylation domain-containing protein [Stieleria sp. JC731]